MEGRFRCLCLLMSEFNIEAGEPDPGPVPGEIEGDLNGAFSLVAAEHAAPGGVRSIHINCDIVNLKVIQSQGGELELNPSEGR